MIVFAVYPRAMSLSNVIPAACAVRRISATQVVKGSAR